jgi:hypothetical protein
MQAASCHRSFSQGIGGFCSEFVSYRARLALLPTGFDIDDLKILDVVNRIGAEG